MSVQPDPLNREKSLRMCIGCCQPIHASARVCPHCRSVQTRNRWHTLGGAMKWIGGITALLSLIFGMVQLNTLIRDKINRDRAVDELIDAARYQAEADDLDGAWSLAEQAMQLNPVAPGIRWLQVELAMQQVRKINRVKRDHWKETAKTLIPVLHRGVFYGTPRQRADVLAHLARANSILYWHGDTWVDADLHFKQALELDPENVFAHVYYGALILDKEDHKYNEEKMALAMEHFRRAVQSGREYQWARGLQVNRLTAFLSRNDHTPKCHPQIGSELIAIGEQLKNNPAELPKWIYSALVEKFDFIDKQWEMRDAFFQRCPPDRVLDIYRFLCANAGELSCHSLPYLEQKLFIEALLLEADDQLEGAFSCLIEIYAECGFFRQEYQSKIRTVRERLWEKQGYLLSDTFCLRSMTIGSPAHMAGMQYEDILLRIADRRITRIDEWKTVQAGLPRETRHYPVRLLRGRQVITLSVPNAPLQGVGGYMCKVPQPWTDTNYQQKTAITTSP